MDLLLMSRTLRQRWRLMLLVVCSCVVVAGVLVLNTPKSYRATTQIFVSTESGTSGPDLLSGNLFTQDRVESYSRLASSSLVLLPVINSLKLHSTTASLQNEVTASVPLNTVLIDLSVSDGNPFRAARLANAISQQLARVVEQLEQSTPGVSSPVRLTTTQPATVPSVPSTPKAELDLILGLLVGIALAIGAAATRNVVDTAFRVDRNLADLREPPEPALNPRLDQTDGLGRAVTAISTALNDG